MARTLSKLSEEELVSLQIDLSNKRSEVEREAKQDQLAVQMELDRRELDKRLGTLTPDQEEYLRERLSKKEQSDG